MKNLAKVESQVEKRAAGATKLSANVKGKIVTFLWELKKQGLKEQSIETYHWYLTQLIKHGANLLDPESVKEVIAKQSWSQNTKALVIASYNKFLEVHEGSWTPPKCKRIRKLPFIPLESELDQLISGANKKMATFLQLLKETGMRSGEALRLKWTDIDFKNQTITLNEPEKYGKPRMFKISSTLIAMLNLLPKQSDFVFPMQSPRNYGRIYRKYRDRMAFKLQNPRLKKISFHTFRHWKATMEYHKTKDILHVMEMLGHRDIKTTLIYTQLINFETDEYHSATAKTVEEARKLIEAGFEYVCNYESVMLFRKRK
jgi:integrase